MAHYFTAYCGIMFSVFLVIQLYDRAQRLEQQAIADNLFRDRRRPELSAEKIVLSFSTNKIYEKLQDTLTACFISKCRIVNSNEIDSLRRADAIFFEDSEMKKIELPKERFSSQIYLYFNQNSPDKSSNLWWTNNFFNWTATYRSDSEIYWPYGIIYERLLHKDRKIFSEKLLKIVSRKTKGVAILNNNCVTSSKREEYLKSIMKHINVEFYGLCHVKGRSPKFCPENDPHCGKVFEKNFKFYLAFEESVCNDFVTEQFFQIGAKHFVVPVVLRRKDYENIAPNLSFIAADDFKSPKELAYYLKFLDKNVHEYNKFLEWHITHKVVYEQKNHWICELCARLHGSDYEPGRVYANLEQWWKQPGICQENFAQKLLQRAN